MHRGNSESTVKRIFGYMLDAIYPRRCVVCGEISDSPHTNLCVGCKDKLEYVREPFCLKCGKPLTDEAKPVCDDCLGREHEYIEGRAAFLYNDGMKNAIYGLKYNNRREYGAYLGEKTAEYLSRKITSWNADALIPVPIHKSRLQKRGYNQALIIAKAIGKKLQIPVMDGLVVRNKKTKVQKELTAAEREKNLENAFKMRINDVKLNTVIVVDDIYTTGSTIDAMARCLHRAGVRNVYYITVSIGTGR